MDGLGYIYFERDGHRLYPHEGLGRNANGFFLHRNRLSYYSNIGLLDI